MAEAPNAVQTPAPATSVPPAFDVDQSLARLEQIMQDSAIAANAQRDLEAAGIPIDAPAEEPGDQANVDEADLTDEGEPLPEQATPGEQPQEAESQKPESSQQETKRYSRRDAARLDTELQSRTAELNELRSRLSQVETTDRQILTNLAQLTGADGTYDRLAERVLSGQADDQERRRVQEMAEWRKVAGPVYRVASQEVWNAFGLDFAELKKLDGVTDSVYDQLKSAPNPAQMLRQVFDLGVQSGRKQTQQDTRRLEAANTSLRTRTTAERPQPVPTSNGSAPKPARLIDQMFRVREDGTRELDPDFERKAERNGYLGADLTK